MKVKERLTNWDVCTDFVMDTNALLQRLSEAVQHKTISFQNEDMIEKEEFLRFHTFIEESFPLVHKILERERINDLSLLYRWEGTEKGAPGILLMAHLDVAPVEDEKENSWDYDPFLGKIFGGYVWGRGTLDIKGQLMGMLEAIEKLIEKGFIPKRTIYLAFGHDEEIGGKNGNAKIASYLETKGVILSMVLDEGGFIVKDTIAAIPTPVAAVGIAEKGYLTLELSSLEKGGHSSLPSGNTAIGKLATAISILETNQFPAKLNGASKEFVKSIAPKMPWIYRNVFANLWLFKPLVLKSLKCSPNTNALVRTTTAVTMVEGGIKENVLPHKARALINFRILPGETVDTVTKRVKALVEGPNIEVKVTENSFNPSQISDSASKEFLTIKKAVKSVFPTVSVAPYLTVGTTDSRYYQKIAPQIFRFSPIEIDPHSLKTIHGVNERISVEGYKNLIRFFYVLIEGFQMESV